MSRSFEGAGLLALAFAALCAPSPATAQAPMQQPSSAKTDGDQAGMIIVSARKTNESVRDVPATITAVSAAQLAATGPIIGTGDLLRTVPGVRFNDLQAPNLSEISIRGSGSERATGADSAVGLFLNGAYVGTSTLGGRNFRNIDMFDLDRVEVLEGPQSALYGRNAEYGVVNIVSAKPKFENSGYVDETFTGGLDQNRVTAVVNEKLSDDWAVRIGAQDIAQSSGFYRNPVTGDHYDKTSGWLARGQIRYRHDNLDVNFSLDGQDVNLPTFVSGYAVAPGTLAAIPLGYTSDRFDVPSDGRNHTEQKVQRAQLVANLDLGWATLTSTSMASHFSSQQYYGASIDLTTETQLQSLGEAGAYPLSQVHTDVHDRTLYEDVHLGGKTLGGRLEWLVGGEILDQRDHYVLSTATSPCTLTAKSGICGGTASDPICYQLLPTSGDCPTPFPASFGTSSATPLHYRSEAAYGSLRYKIGRLTLSGEARYTHDRKTATQTTTALYTGVLTAKPSSYVFSAGRPSYAATISYKLPGDWNDLIYAKIGTGYRAGGVNGGTSTPLAPIPFRSTYGDETTVSYEAGVKGGLGSHVYATLDGYFSRTKNAIAAINDGCSLVNVCQKGATIFNINAGTVHAKGVELAIDGHVQIAGGRFDLSVNGARQHAEYVSANGSYAGLPIVGSKVAQIPNWTASVAGDYRHAITADLEGFVHVVYNRQSGGGQDAVTAASPFVPLQTVNDVSLRAGVDYRRLEAAIFVSNLTDQTIKLLTLQSLGITTAVRYNEPREIGANLVFHW